MAVEYPLRVAAVDRVFGVIGLMAPVDRLQLSRWLRQPNGTFPLRPGEIGRLELPPDVGVQQAMLEVFERTIRAELDHGLARLTVGQVVPAISSVPGGVDSAFRVTNRLSALVHAHGAATWAAVAAYRVREVRNWPGAGASSTAQLVILAVRAALEHLAPWSESSGQGMLFEEGRSDTAMAADFVLGHLTDHRMRALFEHVDLRLDTSAPRPGRSENPPAPGAKPGTGGGDAGTEQLSWAGLGDLVGLSGERCRQLSSKARAVVADAANDGPELLAVSADLRRRLGEAVRLGDVESTVRSVGFDGVDDPAALLAVWLAGPYLAVPGHSGWLSPAPGELVAGTRALLTEAGGVHDLPTLIGDLAGLGITGEFVDAWLAVQPVRVEHGVVVQLTGRPMAIVERVLDATGRAMSSKELHSWMPSGLSVTGLFSALRQANRLVETAPDLWELADWGGSPSEHLVRFVVEVTEAVFDGECGELPADFGALLALQPMVPKRFGTRFGPFAISSVGDRVERGTLRPIVLASGAQLGGSLAFVIDPRQQTADVLVDSASLF